MKLAASWVVVAVIGGWVQQTTLAILENITRLQNDRIVAGTYERMT